MARQVLQMCIFLHFLVRLRDGTLISSESSQTLRFEAITFASEHSCEADHTLTSPENLLDAFSELKI